MPELGSYKLCTGMAESCQIRRLSESTQPLPLAYEFLAANNHCTGVVVNPVTDAICQKRIGQFRPPARDIKLEAEGHEVSLVPELYAFL